MKIDLYYPQQKCNHDPRVTLNTRLTGIRAIRWRGASNENWVVENDDFRFFSLAISSESANTRMQLLHCNMQFLSAFSVAPK